MGWFPTQAIAKMALEVPCSASDGQNHQSPIASVQRSGQLSQRRPTARFESQCDECNVFEDRFLRFWGGIGRSTNTSDSNRSDDSQR